MVVYCCSDLLFATKVAATARSLAISARPARTVEALRQRLARVDDGKGNEPVRGVIVDLALGDVGLAMIRLARDHPDPPAVAAFGGHTDVPALQAARQAGADFVLPNSQFAATLDAVVQRLAQGPAR